MLEWNGTDASRLIVIFPKKERKNVDEFMSDNSIDLDKIDCVDLKAFL